MKDSSGINITDASKITNSYLSSDKEFFAPSEVNSFHSKIKYKAVSYKQKSQGSSGDTPKTAPQQPANGGVPSTSVASSSGGGSVVASGGATVGGVVTTVTVTTIVTVVVVVGGNVINSSLPKINMLETNIAINSYEAMFEPTYENDSTLIIRLGNATQKYSQKIELKKFIEDSSDTLVGDSSTSEAPIGDLPIEKEVQRVYFDKLLDNTYYTFEITTDIGYGETNIYKEVFKTKEIPKDLTYGSITSVEHSINYDTSTFTYRLNINDPAQYLSNINVQFLSLFDNKIINSVYSSEGNNTVDFAPFTKGYTVKMEVSATSTHPSDVANGSTTNVYYEEAIYY